MSQNKLPADPLALILGVVSLVLGIAGCCCYGFTAIIPLIMAIFGLVQANKSLKEYAEHHEAYSPQTRSNVNTGKILNIIAIVFNGIIVFLTIIGLIFFGAALSSDFLEDIENNNQNDIDEEVILIEEDSTEGTWQDEPYETTNDTISEEVEKEKSIEEIMRDIDSRY